MKSLLYYITVAFLFILNKLPMCVLHFLSSVIYYPIYYIARYRRRVVRDNLLKSFPEKELKEIKCIERRFYRSLCDYFMEMIKYYGMSEKEIRKRMVFEGLDKAEEMLDKGHSVVLYMGHLFNWEFVTSIGVHVHRSDTVLGDIYHPLENKRFDALTKKMREQYDVESITMANTLRRIMQIGKEKKKYFIGFIADQVPTWESINYWLDFFHRDTPVFTGTEKIARRTNAAIFYGRMERVKRGYYKMTLEPVTEDASAMAEFEPTDIYYKLLADNIRTSPELWLWTHKRWKRTREGYAAREKRREEDRKRLREKAENNV